MTDLMENDVIIVGGGIVGAACAWALAPKLRVSLIEREPLFGYHSTGRSAALYTEYFGDPVTSLLTRGSRNFFHSSRNPTLLRKRGTLVLVTEEERRNGIVDRFLARSNTDLPVRYLGLDDAKRLCPILEPTGYNCALLRENTWDIDVEALHQSMLRDARRNAGVLLNGCQIHDIADSGNGWTIKAEQNQKRLCLKARILVNATGAWGDELAIAAGVAPLGLTPKRRSVVYIEDEKIAHDPNRMNWPMVNDTTDTFYFKPENNGLIVSPCDETPSVPTDAQPEELDIATAISHLERLTCLTVKRIANRWAGLRTFTNAGGPVIGRAADHDRFFWVVGQGGAGIQTAPATGRALAGLLMQDELPSDLQRLGLRQSALVTKP